MKLDDIESLPKEFSRFLGIIDSKLYCELEGSGKRPEPIEVDITKPETLIVAVRVFVSFLTIPILETFDEEETEEFLEFLFDNVKSGILRAQKAVNNYNKYEDLKSFLKKSGQEELIKDLEGIMGL